MKTRFSTEDIVAIKSELQKLIGMRVNQVYDVDTKTYLFKLNRYDEKVTLLVESGIRIHTTEFEWPKSISPSGFSMKLRKHIKNKRLEKIVQLGVDRILDLQFGINDAAYHVILEMYDRGNLVLTDFEYTILNILRPRTEKSDQDVKFMVREKYPHEMARQKDVNLYSQLMEALNVAKAGDNLKKIFLHVTPYGPALIDHILLKQRVPRNACIGKEFDIARDISMIAESLNEAENILSEISSNLCSGYVLLKEEKSGESSLTSNVEFHPYLYCQLETLHYATYPTFDKAVDSYFSKMEAQRIDSKTMQKEKEAMKKLSNVKKDHERRLNKLLVEQEEDAHKAELIEMNLDLVENAITIVRSAVANQISWSDIWDLIQEAQVEDDPIAKAIKKLKLEINHFTLLLNDPFENEFGKAKPILVDIDLDLSAYGNARKYYDLKRHHAKKEQKTLEASEKAFRNAEKKTKKTLKEAAVISTIVKARKPMWFEKFIWFISSENYLVIAGRDIQQNEVIVKRYMKPGDVYVHADIHGASSIVIKNPAKTEILPKTLNEAGTLAVCFSAAWDAKVLTSAWWVFHDQVSKTAPTGEYLTAGSFMIRGKKNYLLPSHLILGFGFLFRLADDSWERHEGERKGKPDSSDTVSQITENSEDGEDIPIENQDSSASDNDEENDNNENSSPPEENCVESNVQEKIEMETIENVGELSFPDTKVHILERSLSSGETGSVLENNETLVVGSSRKLQKNANCKVNIVSKPSVETATVKPSSDEKANSSKRGKKGKLKKIKEKYKDQDEEERELRMKILASAGEAKSKKKKGKDSKVAGSSKPVKEFPSKPISDKLTTESTDTKNVEVPEQVAALKGQDSAEDDDDEEDETVVSEEMNLLTSLTGVPVIEDTLLYAVPVCAPYGALHNYKYKVKLMPGTGRRGKAGKTALGVFLHEKLATQREKDCLRSVKDQDVSRNFPGKVKLWYAHGKKK